MLNNKTNDEIIDSVIESGRLYPRPRDKCDICNIEIVLCWGHVRSPYWRHLTNTSHNLTKRINKLDVKQW